MVWASIAALIETLSLAKSPIFVWARGPGHERTRCCRCEQANAAAYRCFFAVLGVPRICLAFGGANAECGPACRVSVGVLVCRPRCPGRFVGLGLDFYRSRRWRTRPEGWLGPLVFAGEAIASAGFIGFTGLIAALGFDALSFPLGLAAGLALMAVLVAPRFALYPVESIGGFFTARSEGCGRAAWRLEL